LLVGDSASSARWPKFKHNLGHWGQVEARGEEKGSEARALRMKGGGPVSLGSRMMK